MTGCTVKYIQSTCEKMDFTQMDPPSLNNQLPASRFSIPKTFSQFTSTHYRGAQSLHSPIVNLVSFSSLSYMSRKENSKTIRLPRSYISSIRSSNCRLLESEEYSIVSRFSFSFLTANPFDGKDSFVWPREKYEL